MTLDEIARRFNAQRSGTGYKAHCPVHDDHVESLSISGDRQRVLVHCHAGCDTKDVLAAVGLTMRDLFNAPARSPVSKTYVYRDQLGVPRYRKVRHADKTFHFEKPDGRGGWITSSKQNGGKPVMAGVRRLLYRLNELRDASHDSTETFTIYVVEGEKDADRLWSLGLPATTNDGGAGKWTDALTTQLKNVDATDVLLLGDHDDPGRAHVQQVAQSCAAAGLHVRIVDLPDLPLHGDVSDYLDAGHTAEELFALCRAAPAYVPPPPPGTSTRPVPLATAPRTLTEAHAIFTHWLGEHYDLDALDVVLAAAAAERLTGDPLWVLLVSGPGAAKTETVQALSGIGAFTVSTISSVGALLSASPKRERTKDSTGGLLMSVGERGIVALKDMTSILAMQTNNRGEVLAALREIHDGHWVRRTGVDGGKVLSWTGRLVIIGAVTTAWDTHHSVVATMSDRFVLLRMNSHEGRESAGRHAIRNTGCETAMRQALAEAVAGVLQTVNPQQAITLSDEDRDALLAAANLTTFCRTGVEYDYRGDPIDAHMPEMPTRFAKQLTQIVRGGVAIGMTLEDAKRLAIRCARDSMPPLRLAILEDLALNPGSQPAEVRQRLNRPWSTVKRQLQSLQLLQVLMCVEQQAESDGDGDESKTKTMFQYYINDDVIDVKALQLDGLGSGSGPAEPF